MKVIQINCVRNSGSTGKLAYTLHCYLDSKGIENKIVYGSKEKPTDWSYSIYSDIGSHVHSFLSRKISFQGRASIVETLRLVRYLKNEKPDIVHLHNIHGHYLNYPLLFKYLCNENMRVVWTFHDCWPFTGKCSHYSLVGCNKWKTGCHHCEGLSVYPDSTFDGSKRDYQLKKKCFSSIENLTIVCVSDWLKSQVELSFLKDKRVNRIYNGIETSVFKPTYDDAILTRYSIDKDRPIIIGVSSVWKMQKGLSVFIELAKKVPTDYQVVMVGLDLQSIDLLPNNIIPICRTDNQKELAVLYTAADVCLNASKEETFGMVSAEAMSCGTPVVVSDQTACPEIVCHNTGMVVNMDNMEAVYEAVNLIIQKGKDYFSDNCRKHVLENYDAKLMCKHYCELYKELMEWG